MKDNILLIDKPTGWTSFDVVAKIRNTLKAKCKEQNNSLNCPQHSAQSAKRIRVGHAGTLDPFATGLLIVLLEDATKKQDQFMKLDKEYEATLKLGFTSTTGDPEGIIEPCAKSSVPGAKKIQGTLESFIGEIMQTPPIYSAIKIHGKRAYQMARQGQKVELEPRKVNIYELSIINYQFPSLEIRVNCSSGTYIRTLAEDIGKALGCGAYLTELRRTKIGKYDINNALTIDEAIKSL